jgi:hypothetical protein
MNLTNYKKKIDFSNKSEILLEIFTIKTFFFNFSYQDQIFQILFIQNKDFKIVSRVFLGALFNGSIKS